MEEALGEGVELAEPSENSFIDYFLDICRATLGQASAKFKELRSKLEPHAKLTREEAAVKVTEHISVADYFELAWGGGLDCVITYAKTHHTELAAHLTPMLSATLGSGIGGGAGAFIMGLAGCAFMGEAMDGSLVSWARTVALGGVGTKIMTAFGGRENAWGEAKVQSSKVPFLTHTAAVTAFTLWKSGLGALMPMKGLFERQTP